MKLRKKKEKQPKKKSKLLARFKDFRKDVLTLPNLLSTLRILAVPMLLWLIYQNTISSRIIASVLFILASITDYFDGWLARKYNMITVTGKLLDPLADKFIVILTLIVLLKMGEVPLLPVLLILAREFFIFGIRAIGAENGIVIAADWGGKIKTSFQMFAIPFFILDHRVMFITFNINWSPPDQGIWLLWFSIVFSYQSAWSYTHKLKQKLFPKPQEPTV